MGQGLCFLVTGGTKTIVEVAQQLSWLASAFRRPQYGTTAYSNIQLKAETQSLSIQLCDLERIRAKDNVCWLPLFTNAVVARGFPVPQRHNQETGIEIPFHVMVSLARVMYPVEEPRRGHYLKSFSTLLYPSSVSLERDAVQWHMTKAQESYLKPGHIPPYDSSGTWASTQTLEELLMAQRTFLGYARAIDMHIGSGSTIDRLNVQTVFHSGADREDPAVALEWNKIQLGTAGLGIFGAQATADIIYNKGLFYSIEASWYRDLLDNARTLPVIIYDCADDARCAWMVPTISAVLFMAHVWAKLVGDTLGTLPTAALCWYFIPLIHPNK